MATVPLGGRRSGTREVEGEPGAATDPRGAPGLRRLLRENGLSLALTGLFLASLVGHSIAGMHVYNDQLRDHGERELAYAAYLVSSHFAESVFENWESEFLQMGALVVLSAVLYQKGSPESKKIDGHESVDDDPAAKRTDPGAPWPVRAGGAWLSLYRNSLSIALFGMFAASFVLHGAGGLSAYNQEQRQHGAPEVALLGYMTSATFWFESLQNWQSEFLSAAALVVLSIHLRQQGSPESKPVAAPHSETGHG
jgi:hypothetical protein